MVGRFFSCGGGVLSFFPDDHFDGEAP